MSNENWDPAVGMQQDPNSNKDNKKTILIAIGFLLAAIIGAPTLMIAIFNRERSNRDGEYAYTKTLENLIRNVGTQIKERNDCKNGVQGYYRFEKIQGKKTIDEVVICNNNYVFNKPTATEYWRLLAHESTHIMQACLGTNLYGSYQIKDMSYELMDQDENSYRTIHSAYSSSNEDNEIEARWMELQPKQYVIDTLRKHCMERPQDL
mgnify:FL=1